MEIEKIAAALGGAANLFSKRAVKYREMKLSERRLTDAEMVYLMTSDYTFLKRPIMSIGEFVVAGFFEMSFERFLEQHYFEPKPSRHNMRHDEF